MKKIKLNARDGTALKLNFRNDHRQLNGTGQAGRKAH
jgi:hypothetical protein